MSASASARAGRPEALDELAAAGWRTCVISSFSRRQLGGILAALGWQDRFDLAVSADDVPRGCPCPDPVLRAMLGLGVDDVRDTLIVQATESGVRSGQRSGAGLVAGVLTGAHPAARLRSAGAAQVLGSVADLPAMLAAAGPGHAASLGPRPRPGPDDWCPAGGRGPAAEDRSGGRPSAGEGLIARGQPGCGGARRAVCRVALDGTPWGYSSAGRAPALQAGGQGFESP